MDLIPIDPRGRTVWIAALPVLIGCAPIEEAHSAPPALPDRIANNAVASVETPDGWVVLSFLGIDSSKAWNGVTTASYRWETGEPEWHRIEPPPGPGRLAATAQAWGGRVYLFGGYTVAEDGSEKSVPAVDVYDPQTGEWSAAAPMPLPVDDAVSGVWRDSLIFLVSGWHDTDNVADVQIYDPAADTWQSASPIPGPPVFGHTGGIAGDAIIYVDGARVDTDPRAFSLESSSWIGHIDPEQPTTIRWEPLPDHPGPPVYRAAAIGLGDRVVIGGGSDNTYNYTGQGYDGRPSEPVGGVFAYDVTAGTWTEVGRLSTPTMDHRGIVEVDGELYIIGGMETAQEVTSRVAPVPLTPGPE